MNSFGRIFRIGIMGESHGKGLGVVIDGCPAGFDMDPSDFLPDLERRMGNLVGVTRRREDDIPQIASGVFNGKTTGAPILIWFENHDVDSGPYEELKNRPRPGHADWVAGEKFRGFNDYRGGGMFSGRLTAGLVAAGVVAKKLIAPVDIEAKVSAVGGENDVDTAVARAKARGDSVGGIVECRVKNIPTGLGEPFFDSVESLVSHLVFSIGGVRGIEFGSGFKCAEMLGSECNDQYSGSSGQTDTNHAGGVNGGITNGNELVFRICVKPTSSISRPQKSFDLETGEPVEISIEGRHDVCIALRVPVVLEAATAIVLADLKLIKNSFDLTPGLTNHPIEVAGHKAV